MANRTGTLTSSQGSAFIGTTPNDTITFTPSAGTYTVEYPLGTAAISASTGVQSLAVSGGQLRVTCASGSVSWSVADGNDGTPLSQTELSSVRSLVSGAGNLVVPPQTRDSDGIDIAIAMCVAAGGGTVLMDADPAGYNITRDHTMASGVHFVGVPNAPIVTGDVPDFWSIGHGTVWNLAAGVTGLKWNNTNKGVEETNLMDFALCNARVFGIAFNGGLRAIDIGAVNAMGALFSGIDQIYCYNQSGDYAIDIKNSQFFQHGRIRCQTTLTTGGGYRIANLLGTSLLTGDSHVDELFVRSNYVRNKGVVFEAAGVSGSTLNDVKVTGRIHSSRYRAFTPDTVSMVFANTSADITVSDAGQYADMALGMPVKFQTTAPGGYDAGVVYFVVYRNGTNIIRLGEADYSATTGIVSTSTGTFLGYYSGYPTFMARADVGGSVKNCNFGDLACEISGNVTSLYFSKTRNCNANINNPTTSYTKTGIVIRDAEIGITYSGANNITTDNSGLFGFANFTNLAGGTYAHVSGNVTIDSSWHGRTVRYYGASDCTFTFPTSLPHGFEMTVVCGSTGNVIFAGDTVPVAPAVIWAKTSVSKATNGQFSRVDVCMPSRLRYHVSGDLAA